MDECLIVLVYYIGENSKLGVCVNELGLCNEH